MQGLVPWAFWLAVHLVHATYAFIVCALIAYVVQPLFPLSNPVLIFLLLLLLDLTNITSTLLFAPFFTTSKNALLFDGLISILLFTIPTFLIFWQEWAPSEIAIIFSSVVFYPLGFFFGMIRINQLEMEGVGANWENSLDGRGIGGFLIVLTVDVALYGLLSLYLDQIVPQEFGVPRPWFFPLQYVDKKRYDALIVARQTVPVSETSPAATSVQSEDLEADPSGLLQLVHLEGICMRFPGASVNAVENFYLNLYQDEIFALLGHNGAGKSTLLHILTGLVAASSGQGALASYDLTKEMNSIRQLIGVCPQHDIHYDGLTVSEHVILFAGIKGLWATNSCRDLDALVNKALSQMDLLDKKHEMVQVLSGGQKRKLSVAMAMVGDPKILVLDEPTAGMDPVSRRALWSILSKSKKGRVTLLTTHQMDEADLVADRKAILSQGRIRCLGTSIYLKHRFNVGYKLDISYRVAASSDLHILSLVNKYIPEATVTSTPDGSVPVNTVPIATNGEKFVTFSLPPATSANFPRLFATLDKQVSGGAVLFYGISAPSLEEVFLKSEGGSLGVSEEVRVAEDYWTRVSTGEAVDEETLLLGNGDAMKPCLSCLQNN
ncbi:P-loop containing nucleoside triphosphate hydrolase protein [Chytriomyces sp. MP71]|nr:P-loop containing nucleoside triphosphate hydrolase protein [Chytriomyces sp. MP71]